MTEKEQRIHSNLKIAAERLEAAHATGAHKSLTLCDCNIAVAWRNVVSAMGCIEGIWR